MSSLYEFFRRTLTGCAILTVVAASAPSQTICIDPGHTSEVGSGTSGRHVTELHVVWVVAKALASRLRRDGLNVVLTKRSERELVQNKRRAEIANDAHAALMLRLHCDAGEGSGFATYYPGKPGRTQGVKGPSAAVIASSKVAAIRFHAAAAKALAGSLPDEGLKTDTQTAIGAKQGALTGSIFSKVPVVLVEMVVLTNPKDEDWIRSNSGQAMMVGALERGVLAAVQRKAVIQNEARNEPPLMSPRTERGTSPHWCHPERSEERAPH